MGPCVRSNRAWAYLREGEVRAWLVNVLTPDLADDNVSLNTR